MSLMIRRRRSACDCHCASIEEVVIKAILMLHLSYSRAPGSASDVQYPGKKQARTLLMCSQRRPILTEEPE